MLQLKDIWVVSRFWMNKVAMDIVEQVSLWDSGAPFGYMPGKLWGPLVMRLLAVGDMDLEVTTAHSQAELPVMG